VDLQQEMLDVVKRRATRKGLIDRIVTHRCSVDDIGFTEQVDFIIAFWMVHEVPDQRALLTQLRYVAGPECRLLIAEPKMHVTADDLERTVEHANEAGWDYLEAPAVRLSHSAVLGVASCAGGTP
jgi:2-polyprenyl-3-methyl-5-hydroxy-6-metoxy-1,4-benzoquinol methylase